MTEVNFEYLTEVTYNGTTITEVVYNSISVWKSFIEFSVSKLLTVTGLNINDSVATFEHPPTGVDDHDLPSNGIYDFRIKQESVATGTTTPYIFSHTLFVLFKLSNGTYALTYNYSDTPTIPPGNWSAEYDNQKAARDHSHNTFVEGQVITYGLKITDVIVLGEVVGNKNAVHTYTKSTVELKNHPEAW